MVEPKGRTNVPQLNHPKDDLAVGDRAPNFVLPDGAGRFVMFYERTQGRPVVLLLAPAAKAPATVAVMQAVRSRAAAFDQLGVDIFWLSGAPLAEAADTSGRWGEDGLGTWWDAEGKVTAALLTGLGYQNAAHQGIGDRVVALLLDANQRILEVLDGDGPDLLERAYAHYCHATTAKPPVLRHTAAPVLSMPYLIDPPWCDALVGLWHELERRNAGLPVGSMMASAFGGGLEGAMARECREHVIADPAIQRRLQEVIGRRVGPELQKAFSFSGVRFHPFALRRYSPGIGETLNPWAEMDEPRPKDRRFSMVLSLNARAEEGTQDGYVGGEMMFPEYGRECYAPGRGGALIHSTNLMLELRPVTQGRRYVLSCVLSDQPPAPEAPTP